jgi:L,D-transpeptidase YbiS
MLMPDDYLHIDIGTQCLRFYRQGKVCADYWVSTARNCAGEQLGSEKTPRGWHRIRAKIGTGCEIGTVFAGRRPTGEIFSESLQQAQPDRDWILTRILWLCGNETGKNRSGEVDTMRRFIYIHGCPDSEPMGHPGSHGCVRMRNVDIIALYDEVPVGLPVLIEE